MKRLFVIIASGMLLVLLALGVKSCGKNSSIIVCTEHPEKRKIIETVSANGKIQPEVEVKISSDVSGEVIELLVKEGDRVKKGDLLCRIKPDIYESALERVSATVNSSKASYETSLAQLEQVKANLIQAEAAYNRTKKLYEQNAISQQEFESSKAQFESLKAQVKAASENVHGAEYNISSTQASLREAGENLSKTRIYAPVDGTVSKLNVEKGERVLGMNSLQGTEIMRLANLNEMEVSIEVNENDIIRVKKNDQALIEVDAYNNKAFKGIVTEIANSANAAGNGLSSDQATNFTVKIRILQESYKSLITDSGMAPFRPGMSASVEIQTKTVNHVWSVPIQCVTTRTDTLVTEKKKDKEEDELEVKNLQEEKKQKEEKKKEEIVFVVKDGKAKKVVVKTGIQDNDYIEILSGLSGNDEVISGPYTAISKRLNEGSVVRITDKEKLYKEQK